MEAKEIKLELCKIALHTGAPMERVEQMYDWIMKGEEVGEETNTEQKDISLRPRPISEIPISEIVLCMTKYDLGRGLSTRFARVARMYDINTLGDLLKMGKFEFSRLHNVGSVLLLNLNRSLEELYGIKSW